MNGCTAKFEKCVYVLRRHLVSSDFRAVVVQLGLLSAVVVLMSFRPYLVRDRERKRIFVDLFTIAADFGHVNCDTERLLSLSC